MKDINNTTDDDVELANADDGYCVTGTHRCRECAYVNYGRDCHNRPLAPPVVTLNDLYRDCGVPEWCED